MNLQQGDIKRRLMVVLLIAFLVASVKMAGSSKSLMILLEIFRSKYWKNALLWPDLPVKQHPNSFEKLICMVLLLMRGGNRISLWLITLEFQHVMTPQRFLMKSLWPQILWRCCVYFSLSSSLLCKEFFNLLLKDNNWIRKALFVFVLELGRGRI